MTAMIQIRKVTILAVIGFGLVWFATSCTNRGDPVDLKRIAANLHVAPESVELERIMYDKDRDWYGVFFNVRGAPPEIAAAVYSLKNFGEESQERHDLRRYRAAYADLRRLQWGPPEKYANCSQYVGVWDHHFLVYVALCKDGVHGYFESEYGVAPGPGPYN